MTIDATPVCILHGAGIGGHDAYVFYTDSDRQANADVKGDLDGNTIITLTAAEALHSAKVTIGGKEHLIISDAEAVTDAEGHVQLYFEVSQEEKFKTPQFRIYPDIDYEPPGFEKEKKAGEVQDFMSGDAFALYQGKNRIENVLSAEFSQKSETVYEIRLPGKLDGLGEIFANIEYEANTARLLKDGEILDDNFYTGQDFEVGLKRYFDKFGERDELTFELELEPLCEDDRIYLQNWPTMRDGKACRLVNILLIVQYCIKIS